jgi:integrase
VANKKVSLIRKCKTPNGWRRYSVATSANGRVKPDAVVVSGTEISYPVGHYELRTFKGSKVHYERIKGNAADALASLKAAQKRSTAVAMASKAGVSINEDPKRISLREEFPRFIQATLDRGSVEAAETYGRSIEEFLDGCVKIYADEVTREDISKFHTRLKARGLSARTVHNRHQNLRSFLLKLGLDLKTIAGKAPRFDKTLPQIYEPDDLAGFFSKLESDYDRLLFDALLQTGLREREAMHLQWTDISQPHRTLQVRSKLQYNHRIKDAEEREMPLPEGLLGQLARYRKQHPEAQLIFGKKGGRVDLPDGHLLRRLKRLVRNAGLNCNSCSSCLSKNECERWFLHRFRATYATTLLRSGMDLRTVQRLMGHSDLASTMRYLRPAGTLEVQDRVNAIAWR